MLRISATGEYALLLVRYLLDHPGVHRLADIARDIGVPEPILRKVGNALDRAGVIVAKRGRGGGISLLRETPTLYDVLAGAGEDLHVTTCTGERACGREGNCPINPAIERLQRGMEAVLKLSRV